jgi:hypothetical protein
MGSDAIRQALDNVVSQPTLSRRLAALRRQGRVAAVGRARATRYRLTGSAHTLHDLRSLLYHQRIADRLARDPALRKLARARLQFLRQINPAGLAYHDQWERLLDGPLHTLLREMVAESAAADALRQESPFTPLITEDDRKDVLLRQLPRGAA